MDITEKKKKIRLELEKLKTQLEELDKMKIEQPLSKFFSFRIINSNLYFAYRPHREDITQKLSLLGISVPPSELTDIKVDPHMWRDIESILVEMENVEISGLTDEMRLQFHNYVKPPDLFIHFDALGNYILFKNEPHIYLLSTLNFFPEVGVVSSTGRRVLHPSNIHALPDIIERLTERYPSIDIKMDDKVSNLLQEYEQNFIRLTKLSDIDYIPPTPYVLNNKQFRNYQTQCLELLLETKGKLIVAPEMGLGKTPIALGYIFETIKNETST